jgi:pSer/pThr/pTyr-binding forkhead associated (FHA) protein
VAERESTVVRGRRFWLILHPGQERQDIIEVTSGRVLVGRGEDCDVVLDDLSASRHHAAIAVLPGARPVLEDLGSANGTFVNGRRLTPSIGFSPDQVPPRVELHGGELLQFGDTHAVISLLPPPPSGVPEPPPPPAGEAAGS